MNHKFRIGTANLQHSRFGGSKDYRGRAKKLRATINGSIYCVQESSEEMRNAIRDAHPGKRARWKTFVHPGGMVAVIWDSKKWEYSAARSWSPFKGSIHGGIMVPLKSRKNGQTVEVIAGHVRPTSVASTAHKKSDIRGILGLASGKRAAVAGADWNLADAGGVPPSLGWRQVTPKVDTLKVGGVQRYDSIHSLSKVSSRASKVFSPGNFSDHLWVLANLTL